METKNEYPSKCPITGQPFFMVIEDEKGNHVPTYGGAYDSYTIPEKDEDGTWSWERFCHDRGAWVGCETISSDLLLPEHRKVMTITLNHSGSDSDLICIESDLKSLIETIEAEVMESEIDDNDPDDVIELTIRIEKKYTKKELDEIGDWDGF